MSWTSPAATASFCFWSYAPKSIGLSLMVTPYLGFRILFIASWTSALSGTGVKVGYVYVTSVVDVGPDFANKWQADSNGPAVPIAPPARRALPPWTKNLRRENPSGIGLSFTPTRPEFELGGWTLEYVDISNQTSDVLSRPDF